MGKVRFARSGLSAREMRRMGERERTREQRREAVNAFWNLSPEERAKRMADNATFQRIQRNGITVEDLRKAGDEGFVSGIREGKEATIRTCFAAVCLTLHEKYGFGKDRCSKVLNDVYERMVYALNSQEAIQEVYDKIGLELHFSDDVTEPTVEKI